MALCEKNYLLKKSFHMLVQILFHNPIVFHTPIEPSKGNTAVDIPANLFLISEQSFYTRPMHTHTPDKANNTHKIRLKAHCPPIVRTPWLRQVSD